MTVVGVCRACGEQILAPQHTLMESSGRTYHLECFQALELTELRREVAAGATALPGSRPRDPAAA